jgi:hypothetical protein
MKIRMILMYRLLYSFEGAHTPSKLKVVQIIYIIAIKNKMHQKIGLQKGLNNDTLCITATELFFSFVSIS